MHTCCTYIQAGKSHTYKLIFQKIEKKKSPQRLASLVSIKIFLSVGQAFEFEVIREPGHHSEINPLRKLIPRIMEITDAVQCSMWMNY